MSRDWRGMILVAVISLVAVAITAWLATHTTGPAEEVIGKWGGFVGTTGIVFGLTMKYHYTPSKRRFSFWLLLISLLLLHLLVGVWVLSKVTDWKVAWWAPITVIEAVALDLMLRAVGHKPEEPWVKP